MKCAFRALSLRPRLQEEIAGLSDAEQRRILRDNAMRLVGRA